jgi:hypothetical protein
VGRGDGPQLARLACMARDAGIMRLVWLAWPTLVAALVAFAVELYLARRARLAVAVGGQ